MTSKAGKTRVLILGGGYAGLMAAARVAATAGAEITLVDGRGEFTQRIRLHELLGGRRVKTFAYAPRLERRGIRFVQGWVEGLDADGATATVRGAGGERHELPYDTLILALGSRAASGTPGVAEHALRLDDPGAVRRAGERLPGLAGSGGRVLVVGGGLSGIETATELAERYPGLRLTLATANRLAPNFSPAADLHFRQRLASLGVELREGSAVAGLEARRAYLADGEALPFDLCVWTAGFEAPSLAREAGLTVARDGRALLDGTLRSASHLNIFVVGDAARAECGGSAVRMSCASALPMGAHAGENVRRLLQGAEPQPFDMGFALRCVSLGRRDGLVQFVDPADRPRPKVWTHRAAAVTKELICKMAFYTPMLELKTGRALYAWPPSACPPPQPLGMTDRPGESLP